MRFAVLRNALWNALLDLNMAEIVPMEPKNNKRNNKVRKKIFIVALGFYSNLVYIITVKILEKQQFEIFLANGGGKNV